MATYLKKAIAESAIEAADVKVQETVAKILADVKHRGDSAVRELSERLDKWSPASFRLSQNEIDALVASIPRETLEDIEFAQAQIRKFAEFQKAALKDIEVETLPGVRLGHRNIPVADVPDVVSADQGPEQRALDSEATRQMNELLATLPEKHREILVLRLIVGLSAEETAAAVGSTAGAIRVAQHRAIAKLKTRVAKAGEMYG